MNKRFFIFFLSTTVLFFFINYYYTSKKQEEYREHQEKSINRDVKEPNIAERTTPIKELPIVYMYEEDRLVSWAVQTEPDSYLTTAWQNDWPERLTVNGKSVTLIQTDDHFALYSSSLHPTISSIHISSKEIHNLQIVTSTNHHEAEVTSAEFDSGQLFFPYSPPPNNGIALCKIHDTYLPVGVYQGNNQLFLPFSQLTHFHPFTKYRGETSTHESMGNQEFYVLENETMQVVFSNIGGAIAEINLPFKSKKDSTSVVLPIDIDRTINKKYTNNSFFPLNPYYIFDPKTEKTRLITPSKGGYYPLLRRGIKTGSGYPPCKLSPNYYAFNTISEDPEVAQALYTLVHFDNEKIQFEAKFSSRRIIKTYHFPKNVQGEAPPYCLIASLKVEGNASGLWISSGVPEVELISGNNEPMIKYNMVQNGQRITEKLSLPKTSTTMTSFQPSWVANSNAYFTLIMDPQNEIGYGFQAHAVSGILDPSRIVMIDFDNDLYPASKYPGYEVLLPLKRSSEMMTFRLYTGPIDRKTLKKVDAAFTNPTTGHTPKYIDVQSFHGWFSFISEPFAKFLYFIMSFFFTLTKSWGFSIILLTVVLRIMMYPLNAWSIKSTLKLQEMSPTLKKLQDKHKNDLKKGQMEIMALYKKHKVNPFGGCLPLLIQMPFLFGMLNLLQSTFSLRGTTFIPGWINNLTSPDVLFSWNYSLPFLGTNFHLLPIILGVVMFFQQRIASAQSKKAGPLTDQQQQQQKMGIAMTVLFTILFYKCPSGLNIYWLSSMGLQILQQYYMSKRKKTVEKHSREVVINPKKSHIKHS